MTGTRRGRICEEQNDPDGCKAKCAEANLPSEMLHLIAPWLPPAIFQRGLGFSCKEFSFAWYLRLFDSVVIVPDVAPTINEGINALTHKAQDTSQTGGRRAGGLVLVRPGIYPESVRVTRNCYLVGLGARGAVVVEAPGWESALVFSGLGQRLSHDVMDMRGGSGEDACVVNFNFRCRNELMRGRCVYIVLGQPTLSRCDVHGSIQVCGTRTAPKILGCTVHSSRGSGMRLTDHCTGRLARNDVRSNGRHGLLIDRGSRPEVVGNAIVGNSLWGVRIAHNLKSSCGRGAYAPAPVDLSSNELAGNGSGQVSYHDGFADDEEDDLDDNDFDFYHLVDV
eukprot:TRINITY_DN54589_c0_g1_i1.p1 TRINITY_DN54589_c0_g1~~TRINITY_DN54589_c0_g1_i1.p1  ORF type:complete len:354 (+),score=39.22 TRINITY_DN54589_c0_g1_i1:52-1062(+)